MNKLSRGQRAQIIGMMVEGMSIRSITRLTGVSKNTVAKLLVDAGRACLDYQDRTLRHLSCKRVQVDERWAFVYAKERNVPGAKQAPKGAGDIWTWTAICADTKLVPSWLVGDRSGDTAKRFICDLSGRLANRIQLTSDGHKVYLNAVEEGFGAAIDYAQLIKVYGHTVEDQRRYSPPEVIGTERICCQGDPDPAHISTSYVERQNLTMRMSMRRFTRLTNAFSKKVENHVHALSIYFMNYNYVRIHQTLRCTPAMEAGVTDRLWSIEDIVTLVEAREESASQVTRKGWSKRGSC
ncbi:MAG: IS1 family transposase [Actinomycetota bacterium]